MNQDILLSKIVPNPTDTTWSQAYTTLNVYITVSIERAEGKTTIATVGKDILEKLQREFFALDDKSLENIKTAVGNVTKSIEEETTYSIIVGAIVKDILYLVLASTGEVALKRDGNVGVIAKGEKGELIGFSGRLRHDDIIVLQTGDFSEKISFPTLSEYLTEENILTISENITPLVHEASKGTESAIILQYKNLDNIVSEEKEEDAARAYYNEEEVVEEKNEDEQVSEEEIPRVTHVVESIENDEQNTKGDTRFQPDEKSFLDEKPQKEKTKFTLPSFAFLKNIGGKRSIIAAAVVLLVIILIGSIAAQRMSQAKKEREKLFTEVYAPAQKKYDESSSLISLNKSIALGELVSLQKSLKDSLSKFEQKSDEYKKINELLTQVTNKIDETGGGSGVKNQKELIKASDLKEMKSLDGVTFNGGELILVDSKNKLTATFDANGKIKKTYDTDKTSGTYVVADETFIYVLGDSIAKIDKGNSKSETIIDEAKGSAIEVFGSNIYVLNGKDIDKYRAPTYAATSYFTDDPSFSSTPVSMTINGPVYVLEQSGKLQMFSKGKVEGFEAKGLLAPFGENSQVYTDDEYSNLYILDGKNERIVALSDKGEFQTQYEWNEFKDAKSFAIDEKGKKGFLLKNNSLYTFDL